MSESDNSLQLYKQENRGTHRVSAILSAAQEFIADTDALQEVFLVSTPALEKQREEHGKKLKALLKIGKVSESAKEGKRSLSITLEAADAHKLLGIFAKLNRGTFLFTGHLLVALVSRFDSFIAKVARELLLAYPEKLGDRKLTYTQAIKATSLDNLRNELIDEEIDVEMRASHKDQLEYLSALANVPLGNDEPELVAKFIEITERRNCHIHSSGQVSPQYLRICNAQGVRFDSPLTVGTSLGVTVEYFEEARKVLSEMAFKISQSVVRKVFPDFQSAANTQVNMIGIGLLAEERWEEALAVFDYLSGLRLDKAKYEADWKMNLINKAQALIGIGRSDAALKAIDGVDWTASHPKYQLAVHILKHGYEQAAALMPVADLKEENYRTWPLFRDFNQCDCFRQSFSKLFGHGFDQTIEAEVAEAIAAADAAGPNSRLISEICNLTNPHGTERPSHPTLGSNEASSTEDSTEDSNGAATS